MGITTYGYQPTIITAHHRVVEVLVMTKHNIRLVGSAAKGTRISAVTLRELLAVLVDGCNQALRLRTEGRSVARGTDPAWLSTAADFEIVEFSTGSTVVTIESPAVVEAAPEKFAQQDIFWKNMDVQKSAFQMFEDTLSDAISGKADSELFDEALLSTCARLSTVFARGIDDIHITNGTALSPVVSIAPAQIEQIAKLRKQTPHPRMAKVSGKMDMIRHSDKGFELILDSGDTIRGIAQDCHAENLPAFYGNRVLVSGKVVFRPSGSILRIEASKIEHVEETPGLWNKAPKPITSRFDVRDVHRPQTSKSGMSKVFGAWPGDESDEEIERLLG